jgi:hypothetical protein
MFRELFLPLICLVLLALLMVAGDIIQKQQQKIDEHSMWLDFTEQKIEDLKEVADQTQRECIDLLYGN